ncbi:non-ribosomal peptide synthetase [Streptomyces sp. NPDC058108]|uniref:non-ribosomal peptide synthetase n=1 Tax=Streptomyces sp. NPDC058108 TaxID=3346344 RepID=UPI0036EF82A1
MTHSKPVAPTAGTLTVPGTLTELWAHAVARHPGAPSVRDTEAALSYAELDAYSDAVAHALIEAGVRPEDRVALSLHRGVGVFAALLGVLKAGGAYVAVDPRYPDARRDMMIESSGARVVLAEPEWAAGIPAERVLPLPAFDPAVTVPGPNVAVQPRNAACVLFTSGSSGRPKATILEHRSIVSFARNPALPALTGDDRVGQISSLSFDAFHFETWCSLAQGAEIVVLPALPDLLASDLQRTLRRLRVTAMLVPTMAVNHVVREDRDAFAPLRILHTGGDAILADTCRELLSGEFAGRLFNLYGPTEATTACSAFEVRELAEDADGVPIGQAVDGAHLYVLDDALNPVETGEIGQLHVGGRGVARGYHGDPALTAEKFLPDPFQADGSRMYATGDLVRRRADGELDFVGRADHQVKIRGYRVEPGEVERLLGRHPQVREVAVVPVGDGQDRILAAFVERRGPLLPDAVRAFAEHTLPDHMVPGKIMILPKIPATDNGKRDRAALLEILEAETARSRDHQPPTTRSERILAAVWSELLAVEKVGANDDFFALGGNSMLAFRVRQKVKRETGVLLEFSDILEHTVLRDIARTLEPQLQAAV